MNKTVLVTLLICFIIGLILLKDAEAGFKKYKGHGYGRGYGHGYGHGYGGGYGHYGGYKKFGHYGGGYGHYGGYKGGHGGFKKHHKWG